MGNRQKRRINEQAERLAQTANELQVVRGSDALEVLRLIQTDLLVISKLVSAEYKEITEEVERQRQNK